MPERAGGAGGEEGAPPEALVLTGPTATGKTALALELAGRLDAEVVSMDSRQVYRGMDIGTAKATAAERARAPHHGLDVVEPGERYSAGRFARDARRWMSEIRARGRLPLLAGGTGFFLKALTHPLFEEPELPREPRRRLDRYLGGLPEEELLRWLDTLDPGAAARLRGGGGRQRMQRTLEVALLSGRPLSWWHEAAPPQPEPLRALILVLEVPPEELDRRIAARVDAMAAAGLLEEVRGLTEAGHDEDAAGMTGTGYRELLPVLRGERPLDEALAEVKRNTRRYARRQRTWLRHQLPRVGVVRLDGTQPLAELAARAEALWRAAADTGRLPGEAGDMDEGGEPGGGEWDRRR